MKNKAVSFTLFFSLSFFLMLMASYVSNIQNWMIFNASQNTERYASVPSAYFSGGIGEISYSMGGKKDNEKVVALLEQSLPSTSIQPQEALGETSYELLNQDNTQTEEAYTASNEQQGINHSSSEPVFIQYEDALVLEVPKLMAAPDVLKRMISRVLLSPFKVNHRDLLDTSAISTRYKPWFYQQVFNQFGHPIRYPADAYAYAEYVLAHYVTHVTDEEGEFVLVQIPRVKPDGLSYVERYKTWVDEYAQQFNVPKDLVFAIIEVESAFNPHAVSKSNALGLMQLKAQTAGRDVYQYVEGKTGQPSPEELFDAQTNLRMGIAYLGLLKHDYLSGVRNPGIKEMLSISSYNAGISRTLKLFAPTPEEAILRVNQLHPKRVYRTLRYEHASSEARQYLDKVLKAKKRYSELLDLNA